MPEDRNPLVFCRVCRGSVALLLDIGPQPLCNRFLSHSTDHEVTFPFQLGQCQQCGLLQLIEPVPVIELKPAKPLRYTEPEAHLDQVVDLISGLPGIDSNSRICGITSKDQSTIDRMVARGLRDVRCLQLVEDLGIEDPAAGIETIQQQISDGALKKHNGRRQYQMVIARHIFEHAHRLREFLEEVASLLTPEGYLVLEVPDFTNSLRYGDYSTLWEDHVYYFTRVTLCNALEHFGWRVCNPHTYSYMPEDSLVVVATRRISNERKEETGPSHDRLEQELWRARRYASQLPDVRQRWHDLLAEERRTGRHTALLGVGHLGVMFINVMNLGSSLDIVTDDDPEKCGRYLPGSHKVVSEMSALCERRIKRCFMSVSPEGEVCVLGRHRAFLDQGGEFRSIFPTSRLACFPAPRDSANQQD